MCTNNPNITFSLYFPFNTPELHDYIADNIEPFNGSNGFCIEQYFKKRIVGSQNESFYKKFYEKGYCNFYGLIPRQYQDSIRQNCQRPNKICMNCPTEAIFIGWHYICEHANYNTYSIIGYPFGDLIKRLWGKLTTTDTKDSVTNQLTDFDIV